MLNLQASVGSTASSRPAFAGRATTVLGQANPGMSEVLALASEVGLNAKEAKAIAESIQTACEELLLKTNFGN